MRAWIAYQTGFVTFSFIFQNRLCMSKLLRDTISCELWPYLWDSESCTWGILFTFLLTYFKRLPCMSKSCPWPGNYEYSAWHIVSTWLTNLSSVISKSFLCTSELFWCHKWDKNFQISPIFSWFYIKFCKNRTSKKSSWVCTLPY